MTEDQREQHTLPPSFPIIPLLKEVTTYNPYKSHDGLREAFKFLIEHEKGAPLHQ